MIITLLSDLGQKDAYIAIAKSIIIQQFPDAIIIDISHEATPLDTLQAAYLWKTTTPFFSEKSYHLSLTDVLMSLPNDVLIYTKGNLTFLAIDNGLLTSFSNENEFLIGKKVAATFSEYVAICCDYIDKIDKKSTADYFIKKAPKKISYFPKIINNESSIECVVIHIDNYENVITNLTKESFELIQNNRNYVIRLLRSEEIRKIYNSYSEVDSNQDIIAYFNEFGYLQLSLRDKSSQSASLLGLQLYKKASKINSGIIIHFE